MEDEILVVVFIVDFDVGKVGVNAESKVRWKRPRCSRPGEKGGLGIVNKWEGNSDYLKLKIKLIFFELDR